jgi:hypothetical protein
MRTLVLLLALTACAEDSKPSVDDGQNCAQPGPSLDDRCGEAMCGNGLIDHCWREHPQAHCPMWSMEACDGEMTCAQAGFYGATNACNNCNIDTRACDACGPDARRCETLDNSSGKLSIATNGSQIALARGGRVTWFDDQLRETATETFESYATVTAVTGGWLVASESPAKLTVIDAAGVVQSSVALPNSTTSHLLSGPVNGRVLIVGRDADRMIATIVNEQGAIEVQPTEVYFSYDPDAHVTNDGTNFWLAVRGHLVKITTSGTTTTTAIAPTGLERCLVTWNGNGGVYARSSGLGATPSTTFVRFDAEGAAIGAPVTLPIEVYDMVPDGTNVLALTDGKVTLTSIDPTTGTITLGKELGVGQRQRTLARLGSEVVVAWDREIGDRHLIAIAAP